MREFTVEDIKHLDNLAKGLKRAKFQDLSGPEILALAFAFQFIADLKLAVENEIHSKSVPKTAISPVTDSTLKSPIKEETSKISRKKKI